MRPFWSICCSTGNTERRDAEPPERLRVALTLDDHNAPDGADHLDAPESIEHELPGGSIAPFKALLCTLAVSLAEEGLLSVVPDIRDLDVWRAVLLGTVSEAEMLRQPIGRKPLIPRILREAVRSRRRLLLLMLVLFDAVAVEDHAVGVLCGDSFARRDEIRVVPGGSASKACITAIFQIHRKAGVFVFVKRAQPCQAVAPDGRLFNGRPVFGFVVDYVVNIDHILRLLMAPPPRGDGAG